MKAMIIEPSKAPQIGEINGYAEINAAIGGYLEVAPILPFSAYINEEGKILGLPTNALATSLCNVIGPGLHRGDVISGTMIIFGPIDAEGEETGLTDVMISILNKAIASIIL